MKNLAGVVSQVSEDPLAHGQKRLIAERNPHKPAPNNTHSSVIKLNPQQILYIHLADTVTAFAVDISHVVTHRI